MLVSCLVGWAQVFTLDAKQKVEPGSWLCFRNVIEISDNPQDVCLSIAADSKYWLWVNGEIQVREGGLKRGPNPNDTYCDVIRSLPALRRGKNTIAVLVWYFGKDGFSHRNSPTPGMTFALQLNGRPIVPRRDWRVKKHPAFYLPQGPNPNYRLPESNVGFDAARDIPFTEASFNDRSWDKARKVSLDCAGWNRLVERPIPLWRDFGLKSYMHTEMKNDTTLVAYLPYNAQVMPYLKVEAPRGLRIRILTDNYQGGSANNVFAEYKTKDGNQSFECLGWMNGHQVFYQFEKGVHIKEVGFRETGYDTSFAGLFSCDDPMLNRLWEKSQRTLYLTMRDTYMDCPDRERAQWWGDVVNESGEAFYALDEKAHLLTRKGIYELMDWQRSDSTIFSPIPAGNYDSELPMQMLASVGYYGFWNYYMGSADKATIEYVFPKVRKYIHVWQTDKEGLVIPRKGGWTWGDWGDNKDMILLFNQWYAIALQGYEQMAMLVGEKAEAEWAKRTADRLKVVFHQKFWNGSYYVSPAYKGEPDDRAQALAVVSGTLPKSLYPVIRPFFDKYEHASPYMEKYVLQALCEMGYYQDAIRRMKRRYAAMVESPLTTLWEGWGIGGEGFGGGSYNHAWSGGPLTIMSQYLAGIASRTPGFGEFTVCPHLGHLNHLSTVVPLSGNREIRLRVDKSEKLCEIVLEVPNGSRAIFRMPEPYSRIVVNGKAMGQGTMEFSLEKGCWHIQLRML